MVTKQYIAEEVAPNRLGLKLHSLRWNKVCLTTKILSRSLGTRGFLLIEAHSSPAYWLADAWWGSSLPKRTCGIAGPVT